MLKSPQNYSTKFFVFRIFIFSKWLLLAVFFFACDSVDIVKGPVIQPKKESTWVRTEKVRKTKGEVFSSEKKILAEVAINVALAKKLVTEKSNSITVIDKVSCLSRLNPLDLRRTAIQKAGGMWHAFERNKDSKPYSFNGMQLDSATNKMVFGLRYLCQTSQGVPLSDLAIGLNQLIKVHGREKTEKILIDRGEHPEDIKKLLDYEEFARKIRTRKIGFKIIGTRFGRAERFMDLYEDLSKRPVNEKSIESFLSDSVTLLKVLNEFIKIDQVMGMVLSEDTAVPYHHEDQGM